jgi:hypothetical protein
VEGRRSFLRKCTITALSISVPRLSGYGCGSKIGAKNSLKTETISLQQEIGFFGLSLLFLSQLKIHQ